MAHATHIEAADDMQLPPTLLIDDIERIFHLDRKTIGRLCRADLFPQPMFIGGSRRWRRRDIELLLNPPTDPVKTQAVHGERLE